MNKKMIYSAAAAAVLFVSGAGIGSAEASAPVQQSTTCLKITGTTIQDLLKKLPLSYQSVFTFPVKTVEKEFVVAEQPKQPVQHQAQPAAQEKAENVKKETNQPKAKPVQKQEKPAESTQPVQTKTAAPAKAETPAAVETTDTKQNERAESVPAEETKASENTQTEEKASTEKTAQAEETDSSISAFEKEVVELTNAERAKQGLSALKMDENLSKAAGVKSQDMKDNGYFDHTSPNYGTPFEMMKQFGISYTSAGENIAMGQTTPEQVVEAWMNSEGHRANILNSSFTHIGVGYVASGNYWTQMFIGK